MSCPSCQSASGRTFPSEMIIHFSGLRNVNKNGVWVFPLLWICLDCGYSPFTVPVAELALLREGNVTGEITSRKS